MGNKIRRKRQKNAKVSIRRLGQIVRSEPGSTDLSEIDEMSRALQVSAFTMYLSDSGLELSFPEFTHKVAELVATSLGYDSDLRCFSHTLRDDLIHWTAKMLVEQASLAYHNSKSG